MPVFFNGRLLTTPTVETLVYDGGLSPQSATVGNSLALIGLAEAGIPKKPTRIRSIAHAREALRGGELLYAVEKAFSPSPETSAPGAIIAVRVNPAVQAAWTFKDADGDEVLTVKSTDYGLYTNNIQVKIESGSVAGKKVTTQQGARFYTQDNLAREAFTIHYTGAETTATLTVSETQVILVAGSTTTTLQLSEFSTVQRLIERISAEADWTVELLPGAANTAALRGLDALTEVDVKTAEVTVTAHLQAVIDWINSAAEDLVTAERVTGAGTPPANVAFTYLSGGTDGTSLNADWAAAFDALQAEDVQWLAPLSAEPAVWGMADSHCQFMSTVGRRERRCFVGNNRDLDPEQAAADAATINSDRTSYVYPAFYDYDGLGRLTLMPAYQMAAMIAACFASLTPGEPMTNKALRIRGLEVPIAVPGDTDYLIQSGVLSVHQAIRGGYRVTKSISTWLSSANYNRVEVSTGAALDYVVRSVRERLELFVGRKGTRLAITMIVEETASVLQMLARNEPYGLGLLAGDNTNPPYRNIRAEIVGDAVRVEFECSPVVPINFILVNIYAQAYQGFAEDLNLAV